MDTDTHRHNMDRAQAKHIFVLKLCLFATVCKWKWEENMIFNYIIVWDLSLLVRFLFAYYVYGAVYVQCVRTHVVLPLTTDFAFLLSLSLGSFGCNLFKFTVQSVANGDDSHDANHIGVRCQSAYRQSPVTSAACSNLTIACRYSLYILPCLHRQDFAYPSSADKKKLVCVSSFAQSVESLGRL